MIPQNTSKKPLFDQFANEYDSALAQGLSVSGEDKQYFAEGRIDWLARALKQLGHTPRKAMDFGCGTGSATPLFFQTLGVSSLVGVDSSAKSIEIASATHSSDKARFYRFSEYAPSGEVDLVFCNGVFHHIPPPDRPEALDYIFRTLRSGALFSFWENNPWNPGTRYVMSRIPFDRDAVTLSAPEARRLLQQAGFQILQTDFLFIFPKMLKWFRPVEAKLVSLPFGAQYQVLCKKS